jgi:DNA-binding NarL/FixJ family response regulator
LTAICKLLWQNHGVKYFEFRIWENKNAVYLQVDQMEQPIHLLIVDDHPALRWGLVGLFKQSPDFCVVGEAGNGEDAINLAKTLKPDVILMDLALPQKSGLEAIQEIHIQQPNIKIIIFTAFSEGEQILAAIKAGAIGYLVKDSSPQELTSAVRNAFLGLPFLNHQIEMKLIHQIQHNQTVDFPVDNLTDREVEVLTWLAQGLTNTQIAEIGCISEGTVRSHVSNLLNKLGLQNRAQAVIYAIRTGMTKIPQN